MEYLLEALIGLVLMLLVWLIVRTNHIKRLTVALTEFEETLQIMMVSSLPREGFPHQVEACWEDVGARGRFLTDLGGMSIGMREELFEEFMKALNKPISTTPAAGSVNDIRLGIDEYLTEQYKHKDDEFVVVRRNNGSSQTQEKA